MFWDVELRLELYYFRGDYMSHDRGLWNGVNQVSEDFSTVSCFFKVRKGEVLAFFSIGIVTFPFGIGSDFAACPRWFFGCTSTLGVFPVLLGHETYEHGANGGGMGGGQWGPDFNPFTDIFNTDNGCTKTLTFQTDLPCEACGMAVFSELDVSAIMFLCGAGVPPGTRPETCRTCRGSGMINKSTGPFRVQITCSYCHGTGKIVKNFCKSCNGEKTVRGPKTVKLDIMPGILSRFGEEGGGGCGGEAAAPVSSDCSSEDGGWRAVPAIILNPALGQVGVDDNETMKVSRSGGADPDGNQAGDLYVTIKVREDPVFRREGPDIHVDAVLGITQAILGGTIQVPTLTGDVVLKVRPGTQPGQKVVLKRKEKTWPPCSGVKTLKGVCEHACHDRVQMPAHDRGSKLGILTLLGINMCTSMSASQCRNLTQRQRELIEEFAKEEQGDYVKGAAAGGSV
ncbi:hypothetical protein TEA_012953 [Camellia sinensis var. sinensis]|uniref:CR-type domain-containing protein n=1 Tax=Camellia sinensis var. sinensis TaxID=542762 RepID=A0A4S4F380_CAMSN|nr:hypothetical protein TEA_012953 [Camellia sinensis var. sinensis]